MAKERIAFLDYTKALGMMLIILAHTTYLFSGVSSHGIPESCHVPIFFIAVGLVHSFFPPKGSIDGFIKKRFWGIFIPYVVFSIINSLLKLGAFYFIKRLDTSAIKNEMFDLFINGNGPVWFLGVLFVADIMYFISKKYVGKWTILFAIIAITSVYLVGDCHNKWIYPLIRCLGAFSLIVLGSYSKRVFELGHWPRMIILVACTIIWAALIQSGDNGYSFRPGYFLNPTHSIPLMLAGSYAIMILTTFLPPKIKKLEYIGKNSLGFLVIHPILQMVYSYSAGGVINKFGQPIQYGIFLIMYVLFIVACVPIIELLLKKVPCVLGKVSPQAAK